MVPPTTHTGALQSRAYYTVDHAIENAKRGAEQRDLQPQELVPTAASSTPCFRHLSLSPDGTLLAALFEDRLVRIFDARHALEEGGAMSMMDKRPVLTSSPAVDLAWCPFDDADSGPSCLLVAANGVPLQLFDLDDGTVRGSYVVRGDVDEVMFPSACCWPGDGSSVVGGYSRGRVVAFDTSRPGDGGVKVDFRSRIVTTKIASVCALAAQPVSEGPGVGLMAAGNRCGSIELFDLRVRHGAGFIPASTLSGDAIVQTAFDPLHPHMLYASSRGTCASIFALDMRFLARPQAVYERPGGKTNQRHLFQLANRDATAGNLSGCRLVAASPAGGVLGFDVDSTPGVTNSDGKLDVDFATSSVSPAASWTVNDANGQALTGPTSGLALGRDAASGKTFVAVSVGERQRGSGRHGPLFEQPDLDSDDDSAAAVPQAVCGASIRVVTA